MISQRHSKVIFDQSLFFLCDKLLKLMISFTTRLYSANEKYNNWLNPGKTMILRCSRLQKQNIPRKQLPIEVLIPSISLTALLKLPKQILLKCLDWEQILSHKS